MLKEVIEIEEIKNDINILSMSFETAIRTLLMFNNDKISLESAQVIMSSLNNYEDIDSITIESGIDEKSFVTKILEFIKKVFMAIRNAVFTIFNKLKTFWLKITKQSYKIKSEINQGHFEFTDEIKEKVLAHLLPFNIGGKSSFENFKDYFSNINKLYRGSYFNFEKIEDLILQKEGNVDDVYVKEKMLDLIYKELSIVNEKNLFFKSMEKLNHDILPTNTPGKIIGILGYNLINKEVHFIESYTNATFHKSIVKTDKYNNNDINITNLGIIIDLLESGNNALSKMDNNLKTMLDGIKNSFDDELKFVINNMYKSNDNKSKDINILLPLMESCVNKLTHALTTTVVSNTTYILNFNNLLEKELEKNTHNFKEKK